MGIFACKKTFVTAVFITLFTLMVAACGPSTFSPVTPTPVPESTSPVVEATTPPTPTSVPPTATAESVPSLPPGATVVASTPSVVRSDIQLKFVVAKRSSDDRLSVLQPGGSLTPADSYGIFFSPLVEAFVYIFQRDSTRSIDILFPNPEYSSQSNPVPAGAEVWVPKDVDHWFFLDENVGEEAFIVVATREKNEQLESLVNRPQTPQGELAGWLLSPERGVGGVKRTETVPVTVNGSSTELEQTLLELEQGDGSDLVFELDFQHQEAP